MKTLTSIERHSNIDGVAMFRAVYSTEWSHNREEVQRAKWEMERMVELLESARSQAKRFKKERDEWKAKHDAQAELTSQYVTASMKHIESGDMIDDVAEFHAKFGHPIGAGAEGTDFDFRIDLEEEEWKELKEAETEEQEDDARIDLCYVLFGTQVSKYGPGITRRMWKEVHRANMEKVAAPRKPLKPKGWVAPRIEEIRKEFYGDPSIARTDMEVVDE